MKAVRQPHRIFKHETIDLLLTGQDIRYGDDDLDYILHNLIMLGSDIHISAEAQEDITLRTFLSLMTSLIPVNYIEYPSRFSRVMLMNSQPNSEEESQISTYLNLFYKLEGMADYIQPEVETAIDSSYMFLYFVTTYFETGSFKLNRFYSWTLPIFLWNEKRKILSRIKKSKLFTKAEFKEVKLHADLAMAYVKNFCDMVFKVVEHHDRQVFDFITKSNVSVCLKDLISDSDILTVFNKAIVSDYESYIIWGKYVEFFADEINESDILAVLLGNTPYKYDVDGVDNAVVLMYNKRDSESVLNKGLDTVLDGTDKHDKVHFIIMTDDVDMTYKSIQRSSRFTELQKLAQITIIYKTQLGSNRNIANALNQIKSNIRLVEIDEKNSPNMGIPGGDSDGLIKYDIVNAVYGNTLMSDTLVSDYDNTLVNNKIDEISENSKYINLSYMVTSKKPNKIILSGNTKNHILPSGSFLSTDYVDSELYETMVSPLLVFTDGGNNYHALFTKDRLAEFNEPITEYQEGERDSHKDETSKNLQYEIYEKPAPIFEDYVFNPSEIDKIVSFLREFNIEDKDIELRCKSALVIRNIKDQKKRNIMVAELNKHLTASGIYGTHCDYIAMKTGRRSIDIVKVNYSKMAILARLLTEGETFIRVYTNEDTKIVFIGDDFSETGNDYSLLTKSENEFLNHNLTVIQTNSIEATAHYLYITAFFDELRFE